MPGHDLQLLIKAAQASGEIAAQFWRHDPEIWDKSDNAGPVTEADLQIDTMLRDTLCAARPDYGWLSEETEDGTDRLSRDRLFIVDPIDGTRSFIKGSPTFAHSIAIAEKGQVTAAVVYLPMLDRLFTAERGGGAFLNDAAIGVSQQSDIGTATVLAAKPNLDPVFWAPDVQTPDRHFRSSLAYRLSLVGQGRFDAMLTLRSTWEWDVAAGALIAQEAGALVTTAYGGPAIFNNPTPKLAGMIAAGPDLHCAFLDCLRPPEGL
ncbi:MAG: 3'(2'),5'-bisphosphate nucleotidase CysQ [Pseudoruegeria sp.]